MTVKLAVGSDHAGLALKQEMIQFLGSLGCEVEDLGTYSEASVDYPDYAAAVGRAVVEGQASLGLLVCGTGLGMSIAANKIAGVRAAVCVEPVSAKLARQHNDANVLCLGGRVTGIEVAKEITRVFLESSFEGGRHARRVAKIEALDCGQ